MHRKTDQFDLSSHSTPTDALHLKAKTDAKAHTCTCTRSHVKQWVGQCSCCGESVQFTMTPFKEIERPQSAFSANADADLETEHLPMPTRLSQGRKKPVLGDGPTLQNAFSSPALLAPSMPGGQLPRRPKSAIPGSTGAPLFDIGPSAPMSLGKGLMRGLGFTTSVQVEKEEGDELAA